MKRNSFLAFLLIAGLLIVSGGNAVSAMTKSATQAKEVVSGSSAPAPQSPMQKIAANVPMNQRAMVVDNLSSVLGQMIAEGDNVDVLFTFSATMKNGQSEKVSVTLLQNVKVLAAGAQSARSCGDKANDNGYVVLSLTPRDAQYLALAQAEGIIDVIVRNAGDNANYIMEVSTFEKLFK